MIALNKSVTQFDTMGTIVTMDAPREVAFSALQSALTANGFAAKHAKDMLPRNAFSRAAKELSDERIIRRVDEGDDEIQFQFTREWLDSGEYQYAKECDLWLNKATGDVRCPSNGALAAEAHRLLTEHQSKRCCSDITRLIKKLFDDRKGDLVSLRKTGGVYFVPDSHSDLVEQIYDLMLAIGGNLNRFVIRFGDPATTNSVADALADHMIDLVNQIRDTCKDLDAETAPDVIDRRIAAFEDVKRKAMNYEGLMSGLIDSVKSEIDNAMSAMVRSLLGRDPTPDEIAAAGQSPELVSAAGLVLPPAPAALGT